MATTKNVDNNMFSSLMSTRDLSKFTLMRGVTDYANLEAYNLYESSYSFLVLVQVPEFMKKLCDQNSEYKKMFDTYCHILEYDFRGLSGIDNITAETGELTNGISNVEIINKVTMQAASSFTMRYFERHGSVITRTHELFLRGIKDPRTQIKTYKGLLNDIDVKKSKIREIELAVSESRIADRGNIFTNVNLLQHITIHYTAVCGRTHHAIRR